MPSNTAKSSQSLYMDRIQATQQQTHNPPNQPASLPTTHNAPSHTSLNDAFKAESVAAKPAQISDYSLSQCVSKPEHSVDQLMSEDYSSASMHNNLLPSYSSNTTTTATATATSNADSSSSVPEETNQMLQNQEPASFISPTTDTPLTPPAELKRFVQPFQTEYFHLLKSIIDREYAQLKEQYRLLDMKRKERIFVGSLIRDFHIRQAEEAYKRDYAQAETEYHGEKNSLKERLRNELVERRQRAIEDKDWFECMEREAFQGRAYDPDQQYNSLSATYAYSNVNVRSSLPPLSSSSSCTTSTTLARKSRRRAELEHKTRRKNAIDAIMNSQLQETEIMEDLFLIFGEGYTISTGKRKSAKASMQASQATAAADVSYNYVVYIKEHDNSISYDGITYRKGDEVVVEKEEQEDVIGEIVTVSHNDFWVRNAADGSRFKVSIAQLRQGRTFISHLGAR